MILWPVGVNQKVRRNGTDWSLPNGVIEDKTRSGKRYFVEVTNGISQI